MVLYAKNTWPCILRWYVLSSVCVCVCLRIGVPVQGFSLGSPHQVNYIRIFESFGKSVLTYTCQLNYFIEINWLIHFQPTTRRVEHEPCTQKTINQRPTGGFQVCGPGVDFRDVGPSDIHGSRVVGDVFFFSGIADFVFESIFVRCPLFAKREPNMKNGWVGAFKSGQQRREPETKIYLYRFFELSYLAVSVKDEHQKWQQFKSFKVSKR